MENTSENKAKVFALYLFQDVLVKEDGFNQKETLGHYDCSISGVQGNHLQLKPISSISDEDAIILAQILTRWKWNLDFGTKVIKEGNQITVYYDAVINGFKHKTVIYDDFFSRNYNGEPTQPLNGESFDYLRSKGYALPAFGLSVEELVNRGWIVLTSPNYPTTD